MERTLGLNISKERDQSCESYLSRLSLFQELTTVGAVNWYVAFAKIRCRIVSLLDQARIVLKCMNGRTPCSPNEYVGSQTLGMACDSALQVWPNCQKLKLLGSRLGSGV